MVVGNVRMHRVVTMSSTIEVNFQKKMQPVSENCVLRGLVQTCLLFKILWQGNSVPT
jgi:hypothetical protein